MIEARVEITKVNNIISARIEWPEGAKETPQSVAERILILKPGLKDHPCAAGIVGGFLLSLQKGTTLSHLLEHLLVEELKTVTFAETVSGQTVIIEGQFTPHDLLEATSRAICLIENLTRESVAATRPQSERETPDMTSGDPQC
jgi:hypothetical protein